MYVNGGYAGTTIKAKIVPNNDKPLQLSFSISGEDEGLELVRQQISLAVAERMHAAVMRGERVAWGNSATFTRDGLQHRPPKVLGKAELRRSAYKSDLTYKMNAGVFDLFTPDDAKKPALRLQCSEENFWPGMIVLERMVNA